MRERLSKQLDAVNTLIGDTEKMPKPSESFSDSDAIMEEVLSFFNRNGNTPTEMRDIVSGLQIRGIHIDSARPGASVGAIMTRSEKWKNRFKNRDGLWSVKE